MLVRACGGCGPYHVEPFLVIQAIHIMGHIMLNCTQFPSSYDLFESAVNCDSVVFIYLEASNWRAAVVLSARFMDVPSLGRWRR